ncbi:MAG: STAS domain-containing protein [Victivallaceae bacterium]
MEIKKLESQDKLTCLKLVGSLDLGGVQEVKAEFARLTSDGNQVLLDMSDLTFIASCGMQMVLSAVKPMDAAGLKMAALNPRPMVKTAWEIAGMKIIVPVFADRTAALEFLGIK